MVLQNHGAGVGCYRTKIGLSQVCANGKISSVNSRETRQSIAEMDEPASVKGSAETVGRADRPGVTSFYLLLDSLVGFFTSLRLTVVCLSLGMVLIFWGTIAQVELGLFKAQNEFFRSFFIYWHPKGASWKLPI